MGLVSANQEPDKLAKAGLHTTRRRSGGRPLIDEFPVALECRLLKVSEDGNIIAQIVGITRMKSAGADGVKLMPPELASHFLLPLRQHLCQDGRGRRKAFQDGGS